MLNEKIKTSGKKHYFKATLVVSLLLLTFADSTAAQESPDPNERAPTIQNLPARAETLRGAIDVLSGARSFRARVNVTNSNNNGGKYLLDFAAPDRLRIRASDSKGGDSNTVDIYEAIEVGGKSYKKYKFDAPWEISDRSIIKKSVEMRNEILRDVLLKGVRENKGDVKVYEQESQNESFVIYESTIEPTAEKRGLKVKFWVDRKSGSLPHRWELIETSSIGEKQFWLKMEIDFYDYDAVMEILPPM